MDWPTNSSTSVHDNVFTFAIWRSACIVGARTDKHEQSRQHPDLHAPIEPDYALSRIELASLKLKFVRTKYIGRC
jgi:hypothetical protein